MRNLLALVGLFVVLVVGVGTWRGWLKAEFDNNYNVRIELNTKRATEDVKDGTSKLVDEIKRNSNESSGESASHDLVGGSKMTTELLSPPR